jgi:glycosyltransferase involved in cell wall biosynthesis
MKDTVSVCMSIYNQEKIIDKILYNILYNASKNVKELILCVDGCTDATLSIVRKFLLHLENIDSSINYNLLMADDIWETKANNLTFKNATCDYIISIQDDMLIQEPDFDQRMLKPFKALNNILGVTARNAQDETIENNRLKYLNLAGKDTNLARNIFAVRDCIIRGPIMFDHQKLKSLNYFDEYFAPAYADDKEISLRAYKENGWLVGAYRMDYYSPDHWGKSRNWTWEQNEYWQKSILKNESKIIEKYSDLLMGNKHTENIIIE